MKYQNTYYYYQVKVHGKYCRVLPGVTRHFVRDEEESGCILHFLLPTCVAACAAPSFKNKTVEE